MPEAACFAVAAQAVCKVVCKVVVDRTVVDQVVADSSMAVAFLVVADCLTAAEIVAPAAGYSAICCHTVTAAVPLLAG